MSEKVSDNIIIYTLLDCIHCDRMKESLDKLGYKYTAVTNVDTLNMKGIPIVPALEVNGRLLQHHEALDWVEDRLGEMMSPAEKPLLTKAFLRKYPDHPAHMSDIGQFTYYRTYSRYLLDEKRRETWKETVARAVEYNVGLDRTHRVKNRMPVPLKWLRKEAQDLFDAIFNLRMFISGRTLWLAGTDAARKFPMANFNCSFTNVEKWSDLPEIFYLLMLGSGVGFKSTKEMAAKMAPIRTNTKLIVSPYKPVPAGDRLENTDLLALENGYAKIFVADSKEGWRDALDIYLKILTEERYEYIHTVKVSFNSIRPRGERLKTFGGTASGPEPLMEMFKGIDGVLKNKIDPHLAPIVADEKGYGRVRPIHILDIENLIGNNVVSGGVRRTASLFLFDADDYESLFAKYGMYGIWSDEQMEHHQEVVEKLKELNIPLPGFFKEIKKNEDGTFFEGRKSIRHRRMSNNSIGFTTEPSGEFLNLVFMMMRNEGEPGFINTEAAQRRRPNMEGINPCFRGDMQLLTVDGYRRFDDLWGSESVMVVNPDGDVSTGKVWQSGDRETWKIDMSIINSRVSMSMVLSTTETIYATEDHIFMTSTGEEVPVKDLKGKVLKTYELPYEFIVTNVEPTGVVEPVYDFSEPLTNWGVVEGVVVHNCAEILLDSKQQCNLTTINLAGHISYSGTFDVNSLNKAKESQALSVRAGIRMALVDLELHEWDVNNKRDRLTGCSMTGIQDAFAKIHPVDQRNILSELRDTAHDEGMRYSSELRVVTPLLTTALKPEGSQSLVAGGVSPGVHDSHSPYHIRRIRVADNDTLALAVKELGWHVEPDSTSPGNLVVDFPVKSNAIKTKDDVSALEQFERYLMFQKHYTDHNTSNTITVKDDEWDGIEQAVRDNWDDFVGVSFLSHYGGNYPQAPYEAITKERYEKLAANMKPFDAAVLAKYDRGEDYVLEDNDPTCATGSCPVR